MNVYIDWNEVQMFYNEGNNWNDILDKYKISNKRLSNAVKDGLFKTRGRSESLKLYKAKNPLKHTEETKNKISEIRRNYLKANPDKVPYKLNHSSKESYPEKYFTELFEKEDIKVKKYHRVGVYELDFCILDKKIDIEIDGSQHYLDKKIVDSDNRRNTFLKENGWDIIRIDWSNYQKLTFFEKSEYIQKLKDYLNSLVTIKPDFNMKEFKAHECEYCGNMCSKYSNRCEPCYRKQSRKVMRPSLEQLKDDIEKLGYTGTGRKYGVSDNSIRKWLKQISKK